MVMLDLSHVRKRRMAEKDRSHLHDVTGRVHAILNRINKFGNHCSSHRLIVAANDVGRSSAGIFHHLCNHILTSRSITSVSKSGSLEELPTEDVEELYLR